MKTIKILKRKNGVPSKIHFDGNDYTLTQPINKNTERNREARDRRKKNK